MRRTAFALLLFLAGCTCSLAAKQSGITNIGTAAAGSAVVLQTVQDFAPCHKRPFVGKITWVDEPFIVPPYTVKVAGTSNAGACCFDVKVVRLEPAPKSALAHELGHWFWNWCYERVGEQIVKTSTETTVVLDPDFASWVGKVNSEATRRLSLPP